MTCTQCHTENRDDRKFCAACGQRLPSACIQCGFLNDPGDRFCGGCGAAVATRPNGSSTVVAPFPQAPVAEAPPHLAERLRAASLSDGERKIITVLFADLKGSTALIDGLDPEEARALIDPALQLMMDAVHRYEGYVAQALGDGIFALFGAPLADEDHPHRALYAALRMQNEMHRYSDQVRLAHGVPLTMRVGINTGEVVVRCIRKDELHTDYVPVGHAINLAARMEQMATPGSILITEETQRLIAGSFDLKPLGAAQIKGRAERLYVYEVMGTGPLRTRLQVAAQRGLTRFIGRHAEMTQIQRAWQRTKAGQGQIVGVKGEAGLGKSRLFHEFKQLCQHEGLVLETAAVSHSATAPYLPVIELLKSYCGIQLQDDENTRRDRVFGKVMNLDHSLEDILPYLSALLDIEEHPSALQEMDPNVLRLRMNDALTRLWLCESARQPLVFICEDLHWLDSATRAFLATLSARLASARILLLVNYRPEYRQGWGRLPYCTEIPLLPWGTVEADEFLTLLLGADDSLRELKELILTKTEGTPFFVEEVVQTLADDQVLLGERGRYRLAHPVTDLHLPPTVQGVLAARIDRLPPEEKALLQQLAVIGRKCPRVLIRQVCPQQGEQLSRLLFALHSKEFLFAQPGFSDAEYLFKHALTQEVAYNSVLIEHRKALHQHIAEAIEQIFHQQLEDHYTTLAHHYSNSGNTEKAIQYLLKDLRSAWFAAALSEVERSE